MRLWDYELSLSKSSKSLWSIGFLINQHPNDPKPNVSFCIFCDWSSFSSTFWGQVVSLCARVITDIGVRPPYRGRPLGVTSCMIFSWKKAAETAEVSAQGELFFKAKAIGNDQFAVLSTSFNIRSSVLIGAESFGRSLSGIQSFQQEFICLGLDLAKLSCLSVMYDTMIWVHICYNQQ